MRWRWRRSGSDARANASTHSRCRRRWRCSVEEGESESPFFVDLICIGPGEHDVLAIIGAHEEAPRQVIAGADAGVSQLIAAIHRFGQCGFGLHPDISGTYIDQR